MKNQGSHLGWEATWSNAQQSFPGATGSLKVKVNGNGLSWGVECCAWPCADTAYSNHIHQVFTTPSFINLLDFLDISRCSSECARPKVVCTGNFGQVSFPSAAPPGPKGSPPCGVENPQCITRLKSWNATGVLLKSWNIWNCSIITALFVICHVICPPTGRPSWKIQRQHHRFRPGYLTRSLISFSWWPARLNFCLYADLKYQEMPIAKLACFALEVWDMRIVNMIDL